MTSDLGLTTDYWPRPSEVPALSGMRMGAGLRHSAIGHDADGPIERWVAPLADPDDLVGAQRHVFPVNPA